MKLYEIIMKSLLFPLGGQFPTCLTHGSYHSQTPCRILCSSVFYFSAIFFSFFFRILENCSSQLVSCYHCGFYTVFIYMPKYHIGNVHVKQLFKRKVSMKPKGQGEPPGFKGMKSKIKQMYLPFMYFFNGNCIRPWA